MYNYTNNDNSYPTSDQFVERSHEIVHEVSRPENQENSRKMYKGSGARNFRGDDDLFLPSNQETISHIQGEEAVKSNHYYQPSEEPQFVERTREVDVEVKRPENYENSQKAKRTAARNIRDGDDDLYLPSQETVYTTQQHEAPKASYYYQPSEEPQFVERTREVDVEVKRPENYEQSQKAKRTAARNIRDGDDDLYLTPQETVYTKPQEEAPKASYHYYPTEEPQFVERTREVDFEVKRPDDYEHSQKAKRTAARNIRDGDDDLYLTPQETVYTKPQEEAPKASYHYYPTEEPQFVERTREVDFEVKRPDNYEHSQKAKRTAARNIRDGDDDLYLTPQETVYTKPQEEAPKASYHYYPTEEPQFVERTREVDFEVKRPDNYEQTQKAKRTAARNIRDGDDDLYLTKQE